jgi:general secretion pathway protein G
MNQPPGGYGPPPPGYGPPPYGQQPPPPPYGYPPQGPPPKKGLSVFASVLLALIVFFVVIPIAGVVTCVVCVGAGSGINSADTRANIGKARTGCNTIRQATMQWQAIHPGGACPTVEQLRKEKDLETGFSLTDPWGNPYKVNCDNDEITCTTAGPDHKDGTEDDILVPSKYAP